MDYKKLKLTYDDVDIVPETISTIVHRSECNIFDNLTSSNP